MVKCGGEVLASRSKKKAAPGEMERFPLSAQVLGRINGDITVCLEQEGAE